MGRDYTKPRRHGARCRGRHRSGYGARMKSSVVNGDAAARSPSAESGPAPEGWRARARDPRDRSRRAAARYRLMLLSRKLDDKEIQLKQQSKIFFQISGAGHRRSDRRGADAEAGVRLVLPVLSRSRVVPTARRHAGGAARDRRRQPRSQLRGRQMPSHWGDKSSTSSRDRAPRHRSCMRSAPGMPASSDRVAEIEDRAARFGRTDRVHLARRRHHERRRVLGSDQRRACASCRSCS